MRGADWAGPPALLADNEPQEPPQDAPGCADEPEGDRQPRSQRSGPRATKEPRPDRPSWQDRANRAGQETATELNGMNEKQDADRGARGGQATASSDEGGHTDSRHVSSGVDRPGEPSLPTGTPAEALMGAPGHRPNMLVAFMPGTPPTVVPFLMDVDQVAQFLRLSDNRFPRKSIERYRRLGLQAVRVGRRKFFRLDRVLEFLDRQEQRLETGRNREDPL